MLCSNYLSYADVPLILLIFCEFSTIYYHSYMAGGGGHSHFKHYMHILMLVVAFTVLPVALILLVYSFGAMLLHGEWQLFLWSIVGMIVSVIVFVVLSIAAE
jgi:phosphatidylglycerophosphate synthase